MQINQNVKRLINQINTDLNNIKLYSYNVNMFKNNGDGYPLAQDYCFWLYNGLNEDYQTITFLISNMIDINYFSLRPLYCIMRSSFEKYSDVLNFIVHQSKYYYYINYLNNKAISNKQYILDEQNTKKIFNLQVCNRKTRYYLLGQANERLDIKYPVISEFNRTITEMDSYYSQLLHNNIDTQLITNEQKILEILKQLQCMMYATTELIKEYSTYEKLLDINLLNQTTFNINQLKLALDKNVFI